eukprot:2732696-Pleurochrysis_carterae.AAC.1
MLSTDAHKPEMRLVGTYSPGQSNLNCSVGRLSESADCSMHAVMDATQAMSPGKLLGAPVAGFAGAIWTVAIRI